jgi:hypothetical protein
MPHTKANAALNRLLTIVFRSFPMYLVDAAPWMHPGDNRAKQLLNHMVDDGKVYSQRLSDLLMDRRALAGYGEYPMVFTDTHDLSLDYLLSEISYYQKQDIAGIQKCVADLAHDPEGRTLAEEILGNSRGHLESLDELIKRFGAAASA